MTFSLLRFMQIASTVKLIMSHGFAEVRNLGNTTPLTYQAVM